MTEALILFGVFFIAAFLVRIISKKDFCVLCAATVLSWLTLLTLRFFGFEINQTALSILLGGSSVGFMYYLFSNKKEEIQMFKFPILTSLFWLSYIVINGIEDVALRDIGILITIWIIFITIYSFYKNDRLRTLGRKIIECCKNW